MGNEYVLETKSLGISFGGLKAAQNVNLKIKKNQIYGLIGPNGAGKTTVFNLLTGVYQPTEGTFFLAGEELKGLAQDKINHKGIARTFQNIRLFNNMTVVRNVMVGLANQPEYKCNLFESIFRLPRHFKTEKAMRQRAKELLAIFGGNATFDTPKPTRLIEHVLKIAGDKDTLILDSFAGSGTTAHAVLKMNQADQGSRRFILVEMGDYAEATTAERMKRVIQGYGKGKKQIPGTGGNFSFYELGAPLLTSEGYLNEAVGVERIREYMWYMETRSDLPKEGNGNPHYLGTSNSTSYYFYYQPGESTALDYDFLETIPERTESIVIYADRCHLSEKELTRFGITFKKIPRDITKL